MKNNKVGRPVLPENKKRSMYVCVPCTKDEVIMINKKAKQYKVKKTTLIRMAIEKI